MRADCPVFHAFRTIRGSNRWSSLNSKCTSLRLSKLNFWESGWFYALWTEDLQYCTNDHTLIITHVRSYLNLKLRSVARGVYSCNHCLGNARQLSISAKLRVFYVYSVFINVTHFAHSQIIPTNFFDHRFDSWVHGSEFQRANFLRLYTARLLAYWSKQSTAKHRD